MAKRIFFYSFLINFSISFRGNFSLDMRKEKDINDVFQFFPECQNDGLNLRWAHAVNSWSYLNETLTNENVSRTHMIEGDVIIRQENETKLEQTPVMGHPPATDSDLTFDDWLTTINSFQLSDDQGEILRVGAKADFKSINATKAALKTVQKYRPILAVPLWLNADICRGPGGGGEATPVDASDFLRTCTDYGPGLTLSLGWTTTPTVDEYRCGNGYGWFEILNMYRLVVPFISETAAAGNLPRITFAVRAALAKPSFVRLIWLLNACTSAAGGDHQRDKFSISLWTSASADRLTRDDYSSITDLRFEAGRNRVFIDLPDYDIECLMELNGTRQNVTAVVDDWELIDYDQREVSQDKKLGVIVLGRTTTKLGTKRRFRSELTTALRGHFVSSPRLDSETPRPNSISISVVDADRGTALWTVEFSTGSCTRIDDQRCVQSVRENESYRFAIELSRREVKVEWNLVDQTFDQYHSTPRSPGCSIPLNCTRTDPASTNLINNRFTQSFDKQLPDFRFLITKTANSDSILENLMISSQ